MESFVIQQFIQGSLRLAELLKKVLLRYTHPAPAAQCRRKLQIASYRSLWKMNSMIIADSINITALQIADTEELIKLVNSAYRGDSSKKGWTTEADLLDGIRTDESAIRSQLERPGASMLVAKNSTNQLLGCVYLQAQGFHLYLGMLTVAPDLQGGGLGKQLLAAGEAYGRSIGCSSVVMTVIDVRHELIDWYKRRGYNPTGEIKPFPSDPSFGIPKQPLQFMIMEKRL
jgi:ribosomal protein S18 acetylase RimI-like enzyme